MGMRQQSLFCSAGTAWHCWKLEHRRSYQVSTEVEECIIASTSGQMEDYESPSLHVIERVLPDGWVKRITQRRSGATKGDRDVYLLPPPGRHQRRLRSNVELLKFIRDYPDVPLNPVYVNFKCSFEPAKEGINFRKLLHAVKLMKNWKAGDPKPSDSALMISERKRKKMPVHPPVKEKTELSKSKIKYLNRQYATVRHPSSDQILNMALHLAVAPQVVNNWFVGRIERDLRRSRPIRLFDISDIGMPDPDCHHDMEQFDEEYVIEQDDAEADI